jgi:hypothetical protein
MNVIEKYMLDAFLRKKTESDPCTRTKKIQSIEKNPRIYMLLKSYLLKDSAAIGCLCRFAQLGPFWAFILDEKSLGCGVDFD